MRQSAYLKIHTAHCSLLDSYLSNPQQNDFIKDFRALRPVGPTGRKAKTPPSSNPKSEARNPKQTETLKSKIRNPKRSGKNPK